MGGGDVQNTTESGFVPRIGRSISLDHACELLRISRRTLYKRINDGFLQTVRLPGGTQRVLVESMIDMLRSERDALAERYGVRRRGRAV